MVLYSNELILPRRNKKSLFIKSFVVVIFVGPIPFITRVDSLSLIPLLPQIPISLPKVGEVLTDPIESLLKPSSSSPSASNDPDKVSRHYNRTALEELFKLTLIPYEYPTPSSSYSFQQSNNDNGAVDEGGDSNNTHVQSSSINDHPSSHYKRPDSVEKLSDGSSMRSGKCTDNYGLLWQSSGILEKGSCPQEASIKNCYSLFLSGDPDQHLDPGGRTPRQRIEFLTPGYPDGSQGTFTWKTFLEPNIKSTSQFFHLLQIFSRGDDGPVLTLDAKNSRASILNPKLCSKDCGMKSSIDLSSYKGKTISHAIRIKFGPNGSVDYVVGDSTTNEILMGYSDYGIEVGSQSSSLKFGTYRSSNHEMGESTAYVGEFRLHENR